ncbi:hypothetical protein [Nocardioides sp.]|uniref:hypothetical protein n=1 Tax=Nocardioides sp. TaxID=35761 RepID=UPI003564A3B9
MRMRRLLTLSLLVTALAVGLGVLVTSPVPEPVASTRGPTLSPAESPPGRAPYAVAVLHAWDVRRARAWQAADPAALRRLYVPGSTAGERDVRMLAAWRSRGLRVQQLRTQLVAVRVRAARARRLVLVVTDRVVGEAVSSGGVRTALPRDRASTRVVSLRLVAGRWRVASVRTQR